MRWILTRSKDEDSEEEHSVNQLSKDELAAIIISQLLINNHSTRKERIAFFLQQESEAMERILKAEDFYTVVDETPVSSWLESFLN
jgi:dsDNA-binding SOS-regulon protein